MTEVARFQGLDLLAQHVEQLGTCPPWVDVYGTSSGAVECLGSVASQWAGPMPILCLGLGQPVLQGLDLVQLFLQGL
jgi:hypothetical protein